MTVRKHALFFDIQETTDIQYVRKKKEKSGNYSNKHSFSKDALSRLENYPFEERLLSHHASKGVVPSDDMPSIVTHTGIFSRFQVAGSWSATDRNDVSASRTTEENHPVFSENQ